MWLGKNFTALLVITAFVSACGPTTLSPEQIEATARVLVAQRFTQEHIVAPSSTIAPSATLVLSSTATERPSETIPPSPTIEPTHLPTWTPFGQMNSVDFATAKADKTDLNAPLFLDNRSGETIRFIITSPVYQEYEFSSSMTIIVHEATYTYQAWIGKKGPINGSFTITNGDKHVLSFYDDKVGFKTP
ncbi:MAG TPA: hypothetical protein VJ182_07385 [Anaerolineales bacterium]|nr:hypothetical protein [Anaerolineales bacterium]